MPEIDQEGKDYGLDIPVKTEGFFLKGSHALDWGMKNRLSRIFNPDTGRTVMLAIDHGYFQGPTTGLERIDLNIVPLAPYADTLMLTRGILRTTIPPTYRGGIVLRATGGPSILKELSNEQIAVDMEDAIRLNVSALAVQVFIGGEFETQSVHNMTRLVDMGVEPYLVTSSLDSVLAQRLLRLICANCREEYQTKASPAMRLEPGRELPQTAWRGRGCRECQGSGYRGRTCICELMNVTEEVRAAILERASAGEIRKIAAKQGMRSLRSDGWRLVLDGRTTIEEVLRGTKDEPVNWQ